MSLVFNDRNYRCARAAHSVKERNHLRHCSHFYFFCCKSMPTTVPTTIPPNIQMIITDFRIKEYCREYCKSHTACCYKVTACRAVSGWLSIFKPRINVTEPIKYIRSKLNIFPCHFFFFLNISSMRSVTTNPPTTFKVPSITDINPSDKSEVIIGLCPSHYYYSAYYHNSVNSICA